MMKSNRSHSALLADPPGAGKTAVAINVSKHLQAKKILVLCPASLRENWRREFSMWNEGILSFAIYSGSDSIDHLHRYGSCVVVVSYDLASRTNVLEELKKQVWDMLILDESHALKSPKSKRTQVALLHLWNRSRYRLLMSGTPIPNGRASEAWTTFSRLLPERFGSWDAFKSRYCVEEETRYGKTYARSRNLPELGQIARQCFMVRRTREEVMSSLPPLMRSQVPLCVPELALDPELSDLGDIASRVLASLDSGIPLSSDHIATARRKLGFLKTAYAIEYIEDLLEEDPSQSLVIFAHHRMVTTLLYDHFRQKHSVSVIVGDTPPEDRQKAVDDFQSGASKLFIGSISAASTGITLTRASTVVFVEADWVPSVNEQAEGRVMRLTQAAACVRAIYLYVPKSLDQVVTASVLRKQRDITKVMESPLHLSA